MARVTGTSLEDLETALYGVLLLLTALADRERT